MRDAPASLCSARAVVVCWTRRNDWGLPLMSTANARLDLVVTHSTVQSAGGREVAFDLWRVRDSSVQLLAGDTEPWATESANGHSQVDGVTRVDETVDRAQTAAVVKATVDTILVANDFSAVDRYLAGEHYVQHNHRFADG